MKKILSLGLVAAMAMSAMPMAYATTAHTNGTQVEYVADADANRAYTITVPAKMTPKLGQAVTGTVVLEGKWASNETVIVTADPSVTLKNSINENDTHTLTVNLPKMEYAGNNTVSKRYEGTVTLAEMPAAALFGEWTGKFNYNVNFDDGFEFNFDDIYVLQGDEGLTDYLILYPNGRIYKSAKDTTNSGYQYVGHNITSSTGVVRYTTSEDGLILTEIETGKIYERTAPPETITFTIGDKTYQADWDMTWPNWIDSDYNTDGFVYQRFDAVPTRGYVKLGSKYVGRQSTGWAQIDDTEVIRPFKHFYLNA